MKITLKVDNYRGLKRVQWTPAGVCAVTGANGSGKTTLLSVFDFLKYVYERGVGTAVDFSGGANGLKHDEALPEEQIVIDLEVGSLQWTLRPVPEGAGIRFPLSESVLVDGNVVLEQLPGISNAYSRSGRYQISHESLLTRLKDLEPESFDVVRDATGVIENFRLYQNLQLSTLRTNGSSASTESVLHQTGLNAFSVLRNWSAGLKVHRDRWEFVRDGLRECFPDLFDDLDFQVAGQTVAVQFYRPNKKSPVAAYWAPNGLLVALLHLCAVASTPDGGLVAIDEPENGLHPYAIRALLELMRDRARTRDLTILLSSHSPVLLNTFNEDPGRVYVMESGRSELPVALDRHDNPEWLAHFSLGDLYSDQQFGAQRRPKP
jgi:predicted ATPase